MGVIDLLSISFTPYDSFDLFDRGRYDQDSKFEMNSLFEIHIQLLWK